MLDDIEFIKSKVLTVGKSSNFHFLVNKEKLVSSEAKSACGNVESYHTRGKTEKISIEEAMDGGLQSCSQCVKNLGSKYEVKISTCELCDRINILTSGNYSEYNVPYASGGEKQVALCLNCEIRFGVEK